MKGLMLQTNSDGVLILTSGAKRVSDQVGGAQRQVPSLHLRPSLHPMSRRTREGARRRMRISVRVYIYIGSYGLKPMKPIREISIGLSDFSIITCSRASDLKMYTFLQQQFLFHGGILRFE